MKPIESDSPDTGWEEKEEPVQTAAQSAASAFLSAQSAAMFAAEQKKAEEEAHFDLTPVYKQINDATVRGHFLINISMDRAMMLAKKQILKDLKTAGYDAYHSTWTYGDSLHVRWGYAMRKEPFKTISNIWAVIPTAVIFLGILAALVGFGILMGTHIKR